MIKKFLSAIVLSLVLCLLSLITGCGGEKNSPPVKVEQQKIFAEITDDAGRKIILPGKPTRIVVTSAGFLEPLHAVGGVIVGRPDSKNKMPDWAKDLSSVGAVYQIDVERLLACAPDLVVVNKGMNEKLFPVLEENKIPALVVEMKTYDDVKRGLKTFSAISGDTEAGEKIINDMDAEIKNIVDKVPKKNLRVAILHSTAQGLSVQLDGSIAGSIVKMFGWENVASDMTPLEKNPDAAPYSMETLAEQNPEIIFVTSMGDAEEIKSNMTKAIAENEAWQAIGAVKNNRLYFLPQDLFLLSPGLHYPEAVKTMAELIYPEKF
ncbi:MAG: ABC transporter substrate-binding protein [Selenomonadaceae bacterium]|nr:ABC transporter substrate-binding protein [Selenomonadaceae bacterium]